MSISGLIQVGSSDKPFDVDIVNDILPFDVSKGDIIYGDGYKEIIPLLNPVNGLVNYKVTQIRFSEDGNFLGVSSGFATNSSNIRIWKFNGTLFDELALGPLATYSSRVVTSFDFYNNGQKLIIGCIANDSQFESKIIVYEYNETTNQYEGPKFQVRGSSAIGGVSSVKYAYNKDYFVVGHTLSPYITAYKSIEGSSSYTIQPRLEVSLSTFVAAGTSGNIVNTLNLDFSRDGLYLAIFDNAQNANTSRTHILKYDSELDTYTDLPKVSDDMPYLNNRLQQPAVNLFRGDDKYMISYSAYGANGNYVIYEVDKSNDSFTSKNNEIFGNYMGLVNNAQSIVSGLNNLGYFFQSSYLVGTSGYYKKILNIQEIGEELLLTNSINVGSLENNSVLSSSMDGRFIAYLGLVQNANNIGSTYVFRIFQYSKYNKEPIYSLFDIQNNRQYFVPDMDGVAGQVVKLFKLKIR